MICFSNTQSCDCCTRSKTACWVFEARYECQFRVFLIDSSLSASLTDGTYTSVSEQRLDDDLEAARQIRDKMGGVAEQWRTAANLLRASAKGAILSAENWSLIGSSR